LGEWRIIRSEQPHVLGIKYTYKNGTLLVFHNFGERPLEISVPVKEAGEGRLTDLMENHQIELNEKNVYAIPLKTYGYRWFRLR
jgi:maltose alpha-D-glucosyltransferase/alpha-amylase